MKTAHENLSTLAGAQRSANNRLEHLWLEITEKCNLTCVHCYAESGPDKPMSRGMDIENWIDLLREAKALDCRSVQFIGGEPTIHPGLDLFLMEAHNLGFEFIEVYTNGLAISNKRLELFKKWNINLAVSFYSTIPEVHDRITQKSNSYFKTLDFIKRAVAADLTLRVGIIQIDQDDEDILNATMLLENIGVKNLGVDRMRKVGRGEATEILQTKDSCMSELCGECHKGKSCVTSSGDVFPCIMARQELLGSVKNKSLVEIVTGAELQDFRERQVSYLQSVEAIENCNPPGNPCHPQYGNCKPTEANGIKDNQACNPPGNPCHPQYGNCNPTQANGIKETEMIDVNPCHPQYGNCKPTEVNGIMTTNNPCHPQYGNSQPTEKNGFANVRAKVENPCHPQYGNCKPTEKNG